MSVLHIIHGRLFRAALRPLYLHRWTKAWPLLLALSACTPEGPPPDVLPRDRFVTVLAEAQLIEARVNREGAVEHRSNERVDAYYTELFTREGITREQFRLSFDHYAQDPAVLKGIYGDVIAELSKRKDEAMNARSDSLTPGGHP